MLNIFKEPFHILATISRLRHRLLWFVGLPLLLVALTLGGIACYIVSEVTYPGEQVAKVMLQDTDGYISFNLKPGLSQSLKFKSFLDSFTDTASVNDKWQGLLDEIETQWGINVEEEVQPWLGPELAFGTAPGPDSATYGPEMFFYIGTSDETATQALLHKWLQQRVIRDGITIGNETYRDVLITIVNPQNPRSMECYAITHGYGVGFFGNLTHLHSTIDLMIDGGSSLWDNQNFQQARANLPGERMGMGYFDADHFLSAMVEPNIQDDMGWALYNAFHPYAPSFIGLSISFMGEGFKLDLYSPTPTGLDFAVQTPNLIQAAGLVPGNSLAFVADQNPSIWWQEFLDKRAELALNPDLNIWLEQNLNINAFEQNNGIDIENDIFSWMNGEVAGAVLPYWQEGPGGGPAFLMLFEITDQNLAQSKIDGIINALGNSSGRQIDTYSTNIGGVPATMVAWEDYPGSGTRTKLGYLFLDDFLVAGTTEHALSTAVEAYQNPSSSLAQNTEFEKMLSYLPSDKAGLFYANGSLSTDFILSNIVDMAGKEIYYKDLAGFIEPVMSAGVSYRIGADSTTATIAFHVKKVQVPVTAVSIEAPDFVGEGHDFAATVDICQVQDLHSATYDLHYDPSVIEIVGITSGDLNGAPIPVSWSQTSPGTISVVQNTPAASGHGHLANLQFHVIGSSGNISDITLSNGELDNGAIPADWFGDSVQVFIGGTISGVVRDNYGNPIAGAEVYSWDYSSGAAPPSSRSSDMNPIKSLMQQSNAQPGTMQPPTTLNATESTINGAGLSPDQMPQTPAPPLSQDTLLKPESVISTASSLKGQLLNSFSTHAVSSHTHTGPDGNYTILDLPSGNYYVYVKASGYVSKYYDNVYEYQWPNATPVSVTAPNDTPNINFDLEPAGSISGNVRDKADNPIAGAQILAWPYTTGGWVYSSQTSSDGRYALPDLPSGEYRVAAMASNFISEYYDNVYWWNEATPVSVTAPNNTPNIDFTLGPGGSLSGNVKDDADNPIAGAWVYAWDFDTDNWGGGSQTSADGSYTISSLPPSNYRVRAGVSGYLAEFYDNVYWYNEATPISVTEPYNTPDINFTLGHGGSISGMVKDRDGNPIINIHVYATDYDTNIWMDGINTNQDGRYSLVLPSGAYRVKTCASCTGLNFADEFFDNTYDYNNSTAVTVTTPNDSPNVDFTLAQPSASTPVAGITREVDGTILPGVSITLDGIGPVLSDQDGQYQILATATGNYTVTAHKDGFRDRTQIIEILGLGPEFAVTCNFQGQHGLIPNAPDIWYALDCVNRWLYPPDPETGLDIWTALDVINAWLYPVQ